MKNKDTENDGALRIESGAAEHEFRGYTMEELKYQRALLLIKREFLREKALKETNKLKERIPVINGKTNIMGSLGKGLLGKITTGLGFVDYILIGMQALKVGRKVGSLFRRR